ncbi:transglutaminase domain-containing protein [Marivibrio halodurans]|uniref:Transglutaminase domain-containing protein n=1 Tax=Marivibrio halodurans TaxID=2039722 RepID=A0A8J7V0P8_9PROT|nr:transglutaminase domain-containing protein [Marivibrio halodurans]MBP5857011.1 transglutaminase domain-containing protein [Marivibrio halodurans]
MATGRLARFRPAVYRCAMRHEPPIPETHCALTDPGDHADLLAAFGDTPERIAAGIQGVLLHDYFGPLLHGPAPSKFQVESRATLPVSCRLAQIGTVAPRPPFSRAVGTCRDFALLMTAALRAGGKAARVRCGFANYLTPQAGSSPWYEDHWVCEYRMAPDGSWRRADAQLDAAHRVALGIDFPALDLPCDRYLTADRAWRAMRNGALPPESFGHGSEARGPWFIAVNLRRDTLSRAGRIVGAWDRWRDAPDGARTLRAHEWTCCDDMAITGDPAGIEDPPW